jgi:hypothetical protein
VAVCAAESVTVTLAVNVPVDAYLCAMVFVAVLVVLPSPNFQVNVVKVPEPPEAVAVKLTEMPASVGLGVSVVMSTVSALPTVIVLDVVGPLPACTLSLAV